MWARSSTKQLKIILAPFLPWNQMHGRLEEMNSVLMPLLTRGLVPKMFLRRRKIIWTNYFKTLSFKRLYWTWGILICNFLVNVSIIAALFIFVSINDSSHLLFPNGDSFISWTR
jgi:hypothetical protein